jgi:siroheme synthase
MIARCVVVTGTAEDVAAISPDAIVPRVEPRAAGDDLAKPGKRVVRLKGGDLSVPLALSGNLSDAS